MKRTLAWMFLTTAFSTQCAPAYAENSSDSIVDLQNTCHTLIEDAMNRTVVIVRGPETDENRLILCDKWNVVMTSPISTGAPGLRENRKSWKKEMWGQYTPEGNFRITERVREGKTSNLYNKANTSDPAPLPYWQRLTDNGIGFHQGDVSKSSAGCIRVKYAQQFYDTITDLGSKNVEVVIQWTNPNTDTDGR